MKKDVIVNVLLVFAALFVPESALAQDITQNQNVTSSLSAMFSELETNRVPTGYLLDKAFEATNIRDYDGCTLSDDNYVDIGTFRSFLLTINSASINSVGSTYDVGDYIDSLSDTTCVQLGAAVFKYNYIVSNALTDSLIRYQGGKVYDVYSSGIWRNPYGTAYAFAVTTGIPLHEGQTVLFKLNSSNMFGNCPVQLIEFDPGDGSGYAQTSNSFVKSVTYSSTGTKEIKMRLTLTDNTVLESHSFITLVQQSPAPSNSSVQPDDTHLFFYPNSIIPAAKLSWKCASSHSGVITKPLIFVEGFDDLIIGLFEDLEDNLQSIFAFDKYLIRHGLLIDQGSMDFFWFYHKLEQANASWVFDYDIFYVDWFNPRRSIVDNAQVLESIIEWINNKKPNSLLHEKNILIGHSMGGLISRYALRDMEDNYRAHETEYYVSLDAPHLGANVPLGAQYAVRDASWLLYGGANQSDILTAPLIENLLKRIVDLLDADSAKQMMYYYVPQNGAHTSSFHNAWQSVLNNKGFPKGDAGATITNMAIVNGGNPGYLDKQYFKLRLNIEHDLLGVQQTLLGLFTRLRNINTTFTIKRNFADNDTISFASAVYTKKHLWKPDETIDLFQGRNTLHRSPVGTVGYDHVNSSYLSLDVPEYSTDTLALSMNGYTMFIPSASAIAVNDYGRDFLSNPPDPEQETPFSSYYLNSSKQFHSEVSDQNYWAWIKTEMDLGISCPDVVVSGDQITVMNANADYHNYWSTTDSDIAIISNGTITVYNPGLVTLKLCHRKGSGSSGFCYRKKQVFAGFPQMTLSKESYGSGHYSVTATCTDSSLSSVVDSLVSEGVFLYRWGVKTGTGSIVWSTPSSSPSFSLTASGSDAVSVFLQLKANNGRSGPEHAISIISPVIPYYDYDPLSISVGTHMVYLNYQIFGPYPPFPSYMGGEQLALKIKAEYRLSGVSEPDNIVIGNDIISLSNDFTTTIDGFLYTIYCFDIMTSNTLQSLISFYKTAPDNSVPTLVPITVRNGEEVIQEIAIPISKH